MGLPTITIMGYQALIFCAEQKTIRALTQVLSELDFSIEACGEPFEAVKRLAAQHFDALIVDCDNEQNATLLVKTCRNSETNNASLSVALVEGQAGIAKAFRMGANLVLSKPINVEQSKGTLRVARGLLRKAEAGKAAATSAEPQRPAKPILKDKDQDKDKAAAMAAAEAAAPAAGMDLLVSAQATAAGLGMQQEPGPQPDAVEAALSESIQAPIAAEAKSSAEAPAQENAASIESSSKTEAAAVSGVKGAKSPESVGKEKAVSSRPELSQIRMAVDEAKQGRGSLSAVPTGAGSGAAAAPAKESSTAAADSSAAEASAKPAEPKSPEPPKTPAKKSAAAKNTNPFTKDAPAAFSWSEAARDHEAAGGPHNKTNFIVAAVLVLGLAAAGYFAWPRLEPLLMGNPLVQKYLGSIMPATSAPVAASPANKPTGAAAGAQDGTMSGASGSVPQASQNAQAAGSTPAAADASSPATPNMPPATGATASESSPPGAVSAAANGLPATDSARLAKVPQNVSEHLLIKTSQPVYPVAARQAKIGGKVQLVASVGKDGSVMEVKALSGDPMLVPAAVEAVKKWKYKPYSVSGQAVEFETETTVNFNAPQ